jgi:uncharacterized protein
MRRLDHKVNMITSSDSPLGLSQMHKLRLQISAYIAGMVAAELLSIRFGPLISLVMHSILLLAIIIHAANMEQMTRPALLALALYPLMRVTSLGLPVSGLPTLLQYTIVGLPIWVGIILIARASGLTRRALGLNITIKRIQWQFLFCLIGWPLGVLGALIMHPKPVILSPTLFDTTLGIIVITVFSSSIEETIFRGILQTTLYRSLGKYGIFCSSILFAAAYLGSLSAMYVLIMGVLGLIFAWFVKRTDSLWGVLVAHSLLKCGMLVIWPFFLQ